MQRLGEFDNKVIIEQHNEPENKNVIWKDPDENKYKEYVDGSWVESEKIATPGSGTDNFPYEYVCIDDFSATVQYEDWEDIDSEPHCTISIDEIDIPEESDYFYYVNESKGSDYEIPYVDIGSGKQKISIEVAMLLDDGKVTGFSLTGYEDGTTIIQQASPITFNFSKMIFIGHKKTESSDESEE